MSFPKTNQIAFDRLKRQSKNAKRRVEPKLPDSGARPSEVRPTFGAHNAHPGLPKEEGR